MPDARADREILRLRFDEAIPFCEGEDLARLADLAVRFGRHLTVNKLQHVLTDRGWDRVAFLLERALPMVAIGGDAERGFSVDERSLREIAAELDRPLPPLLADTVRRMLDGGSRNVAKLYVLARLSEDRDLIARTEPPFFARAAHPRRELARQVQRRWPVELIQRGDDDDYNPKGAYLFAGREVIVKENLRLHLDPSRLDGYSQELELLQAIDHPRVVELVEVAHVEHHELLVLRRVAGRTLDGRREEDARAIGRKLAELLAWLHARHILYLDVKPKNLIWDGRELTLCDLGMAQRGTRVTSLLSTLEYVPPEMARTFSATSASDVFQLGIVLEQLFTGRHPFSDGEGFDVALANLWNEPRTDSELVRRMLAKDPAARPSAAEVAAAL